MAGAVPDATSPPGMRVEDGRVEWLFDADADEKLNWTFRLPQDYASGGTAQIQFKMASAVADEVVWSGRVYAVTPGDAEDVDTAGFGAAVTDTETVPGTAGHLDEASIALNMDGAAAGDLVQLELMRDADNGADNAVGDAELVNLSLEYTTS